MIDAELIQCGRDDAIQRMMEIDLAEAARGDGRALRQLQRLVEASGLGRRKPLYQDDGE
jgi:hypothetical protein